MFLIANQFLHHIKRKTGTKNMSLYFYWCHKLLRCSINMYNFLFFFFICCCLVTACMSYDGDQVEEMQQQNPLQQMLANRKEFVQVAGYGEEKLSTVLVTGSVHCEEACNLESDDHEHQAHQLHLRAWPVSGAVVSVNCRVGGRKRRSIRSQGVTDEYGDFMIDLPSELHAIPNLDKLCCARVIRVPKNTKCRAEFVKSHKGLKLSSVGNSIRAYSAGRIRFQNLGPKPPQACIKNRSNN